ncbi:MAG: 4Fe-4S dicluster domain-containing protein [Thermosulfidibacteraceae bacterium]|jgi:heterodisulfide reductase subunit C
MEGKGLLKELLELPGGKEILKCIQCGTCSGSCPMVEIMDYSPRAFFALIKSGQIKEAVRANTYWVCASCYFCTVRCPRGIKITDIMYAFKELSVKKGFYPKKEPTTKLYESFKEVIEEYGRLSEAKLMQRFAFKEPLQVLSKAGLGLKLLIKKRMNFSVRPIKNIEAFRRVVQRTKELESVP